MTNKIKQALIILANKLDKINFIKEANKVYNIIFKQPEYRLLQIGEHIHIGDEAWTLSDDEMQPSWHIIDKSWYKNLRSDTKITGGMTKVRRKLNRTK